MVVILFRQGILLFLSSQDMLDILNRQAIIISV